MTERLMGSRWMGRLLVLLVLLLACIDAGMAQAPSPSPSAPAVAAPAVTAPTSRGDTMAVLYLKPDGEWDRALQESWDAQGSVPMPRAVRPLPWSRLVSEKATAALPAAQRELLLRFPEMLAESFHRQDLLAARYVVLAYTVKPDLARVMPLLLDVRTGARQWLPLVKTSDRSKLPAALGAAVNEGLTRMEGRVLGHVNGKQYHVIGCDHVRPDQVITIDSEREARENGYEACAICFPDPRAQGKTNNTEVNLGREIANYIERRYRLDHDSDRAARVDRVGRRIVESNGLTSFPYLFKVVESDSPNAFAAGAGYVYVTTALERVTAGNDDMLASVMGHEISHTEEHHVLRQYRQAKQWALLGALISIATRSGLGAVLADFAGGIINSGHSRGFETEADRGGVLYAYGAGYRPEDFELMLNALKKLGKGKGPDWLRTHPTEERRLELTRKLTARLSAYDQTVQSLMAVDPRMGAWLRRRVAALIAKRDQVEALLAPLRVALSLEPAPGTAGSPGGAGMPGGSPPRAGASTPGGPGSSPGPGGSPGPSASPRPDGGPREDHPSEPDSRRGKEGSRDGNAPTAKPSPSPPTPPRVPGRPPEDD